MAAETRERLRLFFIAERSRIRSGHLRQGSTGETLRDAPPCLDASDSRLLFSDVLKYGEDRPPSAITALTDFLKDEHVGILRRVPPGRDNLVMAAMISAWCFPHTTIPSVEAFKESFRSYYQSTSMEFHTAAGKVHDLSEISASGYQGVHLSGPPRLSLLSDPETTVLFALAGYF